MNSLLAMYGEGVAKGVSCVCCFGCLGALATALGAHLEGYDLFARRCLWTALAFAIVLILFPSPDFFKTLAGRP